MLVAHNFGTRYSDAARYAHRMISGGWRVQLRRFEGEWKVLILGYSR